MDNNEWHNDDITVEAANFDTDQVMLSDSSIIPITHYFDADGDDWDGEDWDDAVSFVCGEDGKGWWSCRIADFNTDPVKH